MPGCSLTRAAIMCGVIAGATLVQLGCAHPFVRTIESFNAARKRGDHVEASTYLAPDARSWWETKEGPGKPLTAKKTKGRWEDWDRYFNAHVERDECVVDEESSTVACRFTEINDFYRLIDRQPTKAQYVYYFDRDGRICGKLFEPLRDERRPDRFDDFEHWAESNRPDALSYLMNDGEIIPDLERAKRWRVLLVEWREAVGLPAIGIRE